MIFGKDFGFFCPFRFCHAAVLSAVLLCSLDMMQVSIYTKFVVIDMSVLSWLIPRDFMFQTWFSCCFHMMIKRYL